MVKVMVVTMVIVGKGKGNLHGPKNIGNHHY